MPQEFHVIRCFACSVFQVHQVKKKPKWQCKMCGEKQSVRKVYGRGSGKDCRLLVQSLNTTAGQIADEDTHCQPTFSDQLDEETGNVQIDEKIPEVHQQPSKWNIFCEEDPDESNSHEREGCQGLGIPSELVTMERPTQFKRKKSQNSHSRGPSEKRIRQDRNADWESLPDSDHQERGLHPERFAHESMKVPSWESHSTVVDSRQRSHDIHPSNISQTHSSSLKKESTVRQHYERLNPGQFAKSADTADNTLCMQQNTLASLSMNQKKNDYKQHCQDATGSYTPRNKVNEKSKSWAASVPSNSKWAIFAEPDSDTGDGEDFGGEALLDVDISLERERCEVAELYKQYPDGYVFEKLSPQHQVRELNESVRNAKWSDVETYHSSNLCENQSLETRTSRQSTLNENSCIYLDSHLNARVEGEKCFGQPVVRRPQRSSLNSIQNSIMPSSESGNNVPEVWQTNTDSSLGLLSSEAGKCYNTNPQHIQSSHTFHVADEDLKDLPDDFDVW